MSNNPEKCPRCNAAIFGPEPRPGWTMYECGSEYRGPMPEDDDGTVFEETKRCLRRQLAAQAEQLKKATKERNIFRDGLVGSEAELAAAEKRIAALEIIIAKLPKRADGAQGYGLNKDQQKAIADLWA